MKTKISISLFAAIAAIALAFGTSAFKKVNVEKGSEGKKHFVTLYFHFIPNDGSESLYETASSWQNVGSPAGPSCPSGTNDPCVIQIESTDLPSMVPGIPSPTLEQRLAYKVSQQPNGSTYVDGLINREKD